jgi:hypothetical protein
VLPKIGAGLAIPAVASVAGVISYGHIYELTLALHQSVLTARLMPVAIDGLVTVGSVVLLQSGSRVGWLGVGPGLALSVFANVESGIRFGRLAAVWAGIPALSFFLATFILERWLKSQAKAARSIPSDDETGKTVAEAIPTPTVSEPGTAADDVPAGVPGDVASPVPGPVVRPVPARTARRTSPGRAKAPGKVFEAELAAGQVPSVRQLKERLHVGTDKARMIRDELEELVREKAA